MNLDLKTALGVISGKLLEDCVKKAEQNECLGLGFTVIVNYGNVIAMSTTVEPVARIVLLEELTLAAKTAAGDHVEREGN